MDPKIQAQIDALNAAFMQARGGGEDFRTRMPDLTPELLSFILSQQATPHDNGVGVTRGLTDPNGNNFLQHGLLAEVNQGASPEAQGVSTDLSRVNWSQSPIRFGVNSDTSNYVANYDDKGRFTGYELMQDNNNWKDAITAALMLAPAVAGVYGWAGGVSGEGGAMAAGGGAGGTEALSGMDLAADAALGTGNNITTAGAGLSGTTAGTSGLSDFRQGELAGYQTNGSTTGAATQGGNMTLLDQAKVAMTGTTGTEGLIGSGGNMAGTGAGSTSGLNSGGLLGAGVNALTGGNGDVLGGLLGAYLGYQDSKDKQQTSKTEPWGPMQPYLMGLAKEGAGLFDQYKQQPFSPAEQTAYGNLGNMYDFINANAPGLMSGFNANASGQNQFVRGQRKGLIGNSYDPATSPVAWQPGLLGNFGTRKG